MTRSPRQRRRPPPRTGPGASTIVLVVGALVVAAAAVAAIVLSPASSPTVTSAPGSSAPVATSKQVVNGSLPAFVAGTVDPAIGRPAPEVEGAAFDGTPVSIKADGRPKLIVFLAHWCPHCQREVPVVQAWLDANGMPEGVEFLSVATAIDPNRPNYPPDAWLARERWQPPVIVDTDGQIANAYGLSAFPYWVAVDANGTVVLRVTGELTPAQIEAIVDALAPP